MAFLERCPALPFLSRFLAFFQPNCQFTSSSAMPSFALVTLAIEVYKRETPQSNFPSVAQLLTVAIVTYVLAVVAVALRFWARRLMKAQIWVDDWTAAVALV